MNRKNWMKRKKRGLVLACLLTAVLVLAGCGGAAAPAASKPAASAPAMEASMASNGTGWMDEFASGDAMAAPMETEDRGAVGGTDAPSQPAKRIYTAQLDLETKSFDEAAEQLSALVEACGGWFQESSVNDYGDGYRHGSYTVRVPAEKFQPFVTQVGALCHVTYQNTACEDVSEYYYDTAGRLKTQETKLERLQTLLARAESMEDIITIESAISETELAIESLSGELRYYDAQVDWSTVHMELNEVYRLTDTEQPVSTFADRLGTALGSGWRGFVRGMQDILIALAYSWMWLALLAAIAAAVLVPVTRRRRRKREAMKARRDSAVPSQDGGPENGEKRP